MKPQPPMSDRFAVIETPLVGVHLVERSRIGDERGFLSRLYCRDDLAITGFSNPIVQINHTFTGNAGTIRGMHFQQPPHAEDKYVSVLRGEVFDVAVDLRAGSPTFLHWYGTVLSGDNARSLFIPKGFAHGFQTLTGDCELLYLHTSSYRREAEAGLNPLDSALAIAWPLPVAEISARDRSHAAIDASFSGVVL